MSRQATKANTNTPEGSDAVPWLQSCRTSRQRWPELCSPWGVDSGALVDDLEDALIELHDLGLTLHAESGSVAAHNIGTLLDDHAGIAAPRNGLRVPSRPIGRSSKRVSTIGGAEPAILIAVGDGCCTVRDPA